MLASMKQQAHQPEHARPDAAGRIDDMNVFRSFSRPPARPEAGQAWAEVQNDAYALAANTQMLRLETLSDRHARVRITALSGFG